MNKVDRQAQHEHSLVVINDEPVHREFINGMLEQSRKSAEYAITYALSFDQALKLLRRKHMSCCLLSYPSEYEDASARVLSFLKSIRRRKLGDNITVIIIADEGQCDARTAVEFIHQGAQDFLVRQDMTAHRLFSSIDDAVNRCESQKNLIYLAHYDYLTGLLNRGLFMDRLQYAVNQSKRSNVTCSLLYIDVDNFKQVNDVYGHDVGDQLLLKVSEQIGHNCRNTDSAARIGGDEFAVIISSPVATDTNKVTTSIIKKIAADITLESPNIEVSLSVGVAHFPDTAKDIDQLMKQADSAMYKAKRAGKTSFVEFSKNQHQQWERVCRLEEMLPLAIQNGQMSLSLQPVFHTHSDDLVSVKPVVQWSPSRYKVSSDEVLTMIGKGNHYDMFYRWLLPEAFKQLQGLQFAYRHSLSLILSMERLNNEWLLQHLDSTLKAYPGHISQICIALDEAELLQNPLHSRKALKPLKTQGYQILVSQFTGSPESKAIISTLPVDFLQLDSRCIPDLEVRPESRKTLEAAVLYAHRFDYGIGVSDVENQNIYRIVLNSQCDFIEGSYCPPIAEPVKVLPLTHLP